MAKESYDDLIFQLGDLARELLADAKRLPKKMEGVFACEDRVVGCREELAGLEAEINEEDAAYAGFLDTQAAELDQLRVTTTKWRTAVAGVEKRSRDVKTSLASQKAAFRYRKISHTRAEEAHKVLELREGHDAGKIETSAANLKKNRLSLMREQRHIEGLEFEFQQILTPRPGQQGAAGILAHKRILEMEDEAEDRRVEHEEKMKSLDEALAAKDEEQKQAEANLDGALFALGEEVYGDRTPHAKLNPLYPRLDKAG